VKAPRYVALCLLWLSLAGAGTWGLLSYENTPGAAGETTVAWPAGSLIARQPDRANLVMFLHPYCPCSRASIEELNRLLGQCQNPVSVNVLFVRPKGVADDWANTSLRKAAQAIPGVHVALDGDGKEAKRFGAESSGYVVLYGPRGELLFSGGITGSRGHVGENPSEDAVIAMVNGRSLPLTHSHVYGCDLFDPEGKTDQ
jgi:hypothetical protein